MISSESPARQSAERPSVYAYGRSAAVCLNLTETRRDHPTVAVEFASSAGPRSYDWASKMVFQLTPGELAEATAFLFFPWSGVCWIHGQGEGKKELLFDLQQGSVLFTFRIGQRRLHVPVVPRDVYFFRNFLLSRLLEAQSELPVPIQLKSLEILARDCAAASS